MWVLITDKDPGMGAGLGAEDVVLGSDTLSFRCLWNIQGHFGLWIWSSKEQCGWRCGVSLGMVTGTLRTEATGAGGVGAERAGRCGARGPVQQRRASACQALRLRRQKRRPPVQRAFPEEPEGLGCCRDALRPVGALRGERCSDGLALGSLQPRGPSSARARPEVGGEKLAGERTTSGLLGSLGLTRQPSCFSGTGWSVVDAVPESS